MTGLRVRAVGLAFVILLGLLTGTTRAQQAPTFRLVSVGTTVADAERSVAFYRDLLGFQVDFDVDLADPAYDRLSGVFASRVRIVGLSAGPSRIELIEFLTPKGRSYPADSRSNDEWFQHLALVVTDIHRATERLRAAGAQLVSPAPQRFPDGRAFLYFTDPDGHPLELAEFPGETPLAPERLVQRIDHTALVVRQIDESIRFYEQLGFKVESRVESRSSAQEQLNNVFGARLEIVTLRPPDDPQAIGVELLRYVTPSGGRPFPAGTRANDLVERHLTLESPDADAAFRALRRERVQLRTPDVSSFRDERLGKRNAFYVLDPTGHPVEIRSGR